MTSKNNYQAPAMEQFDIKVESSLCLSGQGNSIISSEVDDWGLLSS